MATSLSIPLGEADASLRIPLGEESIAAAQEAGAAADLGTTATPALGETPAREPEAAASLTEFRGLLLQLPATDMLPTELLELVERELSVSSTESGPESESSSSVSPTSRIMESECEGAWLSEGPLRPLRFQLGRLCLFKPDFKRARSSRVSTGCGLATSQRTDQPLETCTRMPIMHSFGFSSSAAKRKHCAGTVSPDDLPSGR
mmetsp:Transcript_52246/g.113255  ORF Transcript_52246/g.113255 Transcript_52246/m.113255 type:complete len:204 (-) Transcript_52246:435-1046(-)